MTKGAGYVYFTKEPLKTKELLIKRFKWNGIVAAAGDKL